MLVYVVTMHRWGKGEEAHSYILDVYTNEQRAKDEGNLAMKYRGGKYEPHVAGHILKDGAVGSMYLKMGVNFVS